jgi:hypothetical protein
MNMVFLLNSKAYSYLSRKGEDMVKMKAKDGYDILFILDFMVKNGMMARKEQCRWVVDYDFWKGFSHDFEGQEGSLTAVGLERDRTPSSTNRASVESRRRSSGSGSGNGNGSGGRTR